jgi:hypothetical protein
VRWTATVAGAGTTPLEYQFWGFNPATGWSVIRSYSSSNEVVWTPNMLGQHAIQVWVRRVGSSVQYDLYQSSGMVDVSRTPATVSVRANRAYPLEAGTAITWTARARGGTQGPLQYQFWMLSPTRGWVIVQPYGSSPSFTWTPQWNDGGTWALQVWVRNSGSTADYDTYAATGFFAVSQTPLHLTTETLFPVAPGSRVEWVAQAAGAPSSLRYQFWVYARSTGTWSIGQAYSANNRFVWYPPANDTYAVQVWARVNGSTEDYQAWRGTDYFAISRGPATIRSLTADVDFPARAAGNGITWTARATGGTGPLQYQFWMLDEALATWTIVQPYSTNNRFTWTPTAADAGRYVVQAWVRSPGSTADYDAWIGTQFFAIQP